MLLSRRGLIGSLLAAPVIIRTPGLLMPIKPQRSIDLSYRAYRLPSGFICLEYEFAFPSEEIIRQSYTLT